GAGDGGGGRGAGRGRWGWRGGRGGAGPRGGRGARRGRRPARITAVDLIEHRGEILGLRVLRVVDEHPAPAVDVDVELSDQALDRLHLVLLGVDDDRVRAPLCDDERPPRPGRRRGRARRGGR